MMGHAPIGGFRTRFNLEGATVCPCGNTNWGRSHTILNLGVRAIAGRYDLFRLMFFVVNYML